MRWTQIQCVGHKFTLTATRVFEEQNTIEFGDLEEMYDNISVKPDSLSEEEEEGHTEDSESEREEGGDRVDSEEELGPEDGEDRHLSAYLRVLSVNTRFVHRYRDGVSLTASSDGVNSTLVAERSSSPSSREVTDSLENSRKPSLQRGWAFEAMNREKKTPRIQLCCLPDEEVLERDLEDVNGNQGDTELEDIDADQVVYPDADATSPVKC
ncbi:hypothetical protein C8R42DRAFT_724136 [Lentinula raphanica]|nr:hypothetical protein C8R42DRAFT_724136 [Lentinula raphanica]